MKNQLTNRQIKVVSLGRFIISLGFIFRDDTEFIMPGNSRFTQILGSYTRKLCNSRIKSIPFYSGRTNHEYKQEVEFVNRPVVFIIVTKTK